ncbi:HAMP domain-containing histidine kinase [Alicyclobacillus tolerans]|nr:HAMP domain-containing sensor histidine kinase [Alicyclobacillus tolerans]MCF8568548.1 HAMP domain-containing histidine kinase [Alicyclobacillus tolerans]
MKMRITFLTVTVLMVILVIFNSFIFWSLRSRLYGMESTNLQTEASEIAQYYMTNLSDRQGPGNTDSGAIPLSWLLQYHRTGQTVAIVDNTGRVIQKIGSDSSRELSAAYQAANTHRPSIKFSAPQGHFRIFVAHAIIDSSSKKIVGDVLILKHASDIQEYLHALLFLMSLGTLGAILLAGFGGYITAATAMRPLTKLVHFVQKIQITDLGKRVEILHRHDEIAQLAITFNGMLERIERSFQQQKQFVADASHEIRTPLTMIQGYSNLLKRWGKQNPDVLNRSLDVIYQESTRLIELAEDLLFLAKVELVAREEAPECDLDDVIRETIDAMSLMYPMAQLSLSLGVGKIGMMADSAWKQVITNLTENAIKYSESPARVYISTWCEGARAVIRVKDEGRGIPETEIPHIFERFYRVDDARSVDGGTGLGLAIVKALVELYEGDISVRSRVDEGSEFLVTVPLRPEGA